MAGDKNTIPHSSEMDDASASSGGADEASSTDHARPDEESVAEEIFPGALTGASSSTGADFQGEGGSSWARGALGYSTRPRQEVSTEGGDLQAEPESTGDPGTGIEPESGEEGIYTYSPEQASDETQLYNEEVANARYGAINESDTGEDERIYAGYSVDDYEDAETGSAVRRTVDEGAVGGEEAKLPASSDETEPVKPVKPPREKEVLPCFPPLKVRPQAAATMFSRLFDAASFIGPLLLTALLVAQVVPALLDIRALWLGETVMAEALRNVLAGEWMVPMVNGEVYFTSPPLYLWFLAGVHELLAWPAFGFWIKPGTDPVALSMFVGSAISAVLLLWAVLGLARFVARFDRRGVFASGCVLLGFFLFAGAAQYAGNQLFFAALLITAQIFMYKALRYRSCMLLMGTGFFFAALAFLAGGPLGLLLPLLSAVLFAFWQGRPWRLLRKDFLLGFVFSLLPAVLWAGSIWAEGHYEVVVALAREQVWGTLLHSLSYPERWWYYLILLPLLLFPWVLLLVFPHWRGLFGKETAEAIKGAFRGDHQGLAYVWLVFGCALAGFLLLSAKSPLELLPLLAPASIIAGRLVLKLSPVRNMLLQRCYAILLLLLAFACAVVPVYMSGKAPSVLSWIGALGVPQLGLDVGGVFIAAAIFLAFGCLFLGAVSSRRPEGTLTVLLLMVVGLSYPVGVLSAPSLDQVLSPQTVSTEIREYAAAGFQPFTLGVAPAPLVYYSGTAIGEISGLDELKNRMQNGARVVVLIPTASEGAGGASGVTSIPAGSEALAEAPEAPAPVMPALEPGGSFTPDNGDSGPVGAGEPATAGGVAFYDDDDWSIPAGPDGSGGHKVPPGWFVSGRYRLGTGEFLLVASEPLRIPINAVDRQAPSLPTEAETGDGLPQPVAPADPEPEDLGLETP